ncbi:MAG: hypothetical protein ACJAZ1_001654 [Yoonia sp.]|jgi:hypothetical protein
MAHLGEVDDRPVLWCRQVSMHPHFMDKNYKLATSEAKAADCINYGKRRLLSINVRLCM